MPGDTVEVRGGKVSLNGKPLRLEPHGKHTFETQERETETADKFREFLPGDTTGYEVLDLRPSLIDNSGPIKLPKDRYFLLGDNSSESRDSRHWGALDHDGGVLGRPFFVVWPGDHENRGP